MFQVRFKALQSSREQHVLHQQTNISSRLKWLCSNIISRCLRTSSTCTQCKNRVKIIHVHNLEKTKKMRMRKNPIQDDYKLTLLTLILNSYCLLVPIVFGKHVHAIPLRLSRTNDHTGYKYRTLTENLIQIFLHAYQETHVNFQLLVSC